MAPKNNWEMAEMLQFAFAFPGPIAIRYPRGAAEKGLAEFQAPIVYGKSEVLYYEKDLALIFVGHMSTLAKELYLALTAKGYHCSLINARFIKPLDKELINRLAKDHHTIITIEENLLNGGYGSLMSQYLHEQQLSLKIHSFGVDDVFVEQGNVEILRKQEGLTVNQIIAKISKESR